MTVVVAEVGLPRMNLEMDRLLSEVLGLSLGGEAVVMVIEGREVMTVTGGVVVLHPEGEVFIEVDLPGGKVLTVLGLPTEEQVGEDIEFKHVDLKPVKVNKKHLQMANFFLVNEQTILVKIIVNIFIVHELLEKVKSLLSILK